MPQLRFAALRRQFEGEFHHNFLDRDAEHELFRPAPPPNPAGFSTEENPSRGGGVGRTESAAPECSRADEIHHLCVVFEPLLQLILFRVLQFRLALIGSELLPWDLILWN